VGLRTIFTKNIGWKIGGLVMAVVLWLHLATEKIYEKNFTVGIEVSGLAKDLRIDRIEPEFMEIAVTGTGKQLLRLSFSAELKIHVDLSGISEPGVFESKFKLIDIHSIDASAFKSISFSGFDRYRISVVEKT
jgi:YbbR domain-containing protein